MSSGNHIPPQRAEKLLQWFLRDELAEEVLGDLEEKFYAVQKKHSVLRAKLNYWYQTLNYLRPFAIKRIYQSSLNPFFMWQHNMKITFRFFLRNKSAFLINLVGLSTGLACAMLIYLWVVDELSFDQFHGEQQPYQVMRQFHGGGDSDIGTGPYNPGILADALTAEMPEVKYAASASVFAKQTRTISTDKGNIKTEGCFAGKDFFHIFAFDLISGDIDRALQTEKDIVISQNLARKLFDDPNMALGKMLTIDHVQDFMVSGVFEDIPANSSIQLDFIFSHDAYAKKFESMNSWRNNNTNTFLTLKSGTDIKQFNQKIEDFLKQKSEFKTSTLFIRPFADSYLYGNFENGIQAGGRIDYVQLFSLLALFILIVACINFMNLSTAKASIRLPEVGVKKVIGATRKSLIAQYLTESTLLSLLSLVVALVLVKLFLPQFNVITHKELTLDMGWVQVLTILAITLFTGILAGSYPAFYLSGFQPVTVLKNHFNNFSGTLTFRNGLVVFQFALSVMLIVAVGVISQQINFVQTENLGYDRENVLHFNVEGNAQDSLGSLLAEVKNVPGVINAAGARVGFYSFYSTIELEWEGKKADEVLDIQYRLIDYDFLETVGIEMVEGHAFSREFSTDESGIILNETAVESMRLENPVGQAVRLWGEYDLNVIGVAKDFNFRSLHSEVEPLFFVLNENPRSIYVKIQQGSERDAITRIQDLYEAFNPGFIFDYQFMDENYQAMYESEMRISALSRYFAGLAVLISCLGLLGLAMFTAEKRTREIGIRKVLGASAWGIVSLLSKDFTKIVLMGILIAIPLSYLIAQNWLDKFAYSIDLDWKYFVGAAMLALFIAWITVMTQALKVAKANPVEALRAE